MLLLQGNIENIIAFILLLNSSYVSLCYLASYICLYTCYIFMQEASKILIVAQAIGEDGYPTFDTYILALLENMNEISKKMSHISSSDDGRFVIFL